MAGPSIDFWQDKFDSGQTPWDRGAPGPQLQAWIADGTLARGAEVLVPGCGSGWDVAELAAAGLRVTGIDYTPAALERTRARLQAQGLSARLEQADVLAWSPAAPVEAIYEQTCLCALHPDHWVRYGEQLHVWLKPGGLLLAMFMQVRRPGADEGRVEGPPYHCDVNGMRALFPAERWEWPKPPYAAVRHPGGAFELAVVLRRR